MYSYLHSKSNGIYAVKYKFHKKDKFKYSSLRTKNKREAEKRKRAFDLRLSSMPPVELNDELVEISGELLKKITSGSLTAKWLVNFARKAHHIQSGGASTTKDYTLSEWIDKYLEGHRRDVKPQTHEKYLSYATPLKGLRCTRLLQSVHI